MAAGQISTQTMKRVLGGMRAYEGRRRAEGARPRLSCDQVSAEVGIKIAYAEVPRLFMAQWSTHTRRELNSPSGDRSKKSLQQLSILFAPAHSTRHRFRPFSIFPAALSM